MGLCNLNVLAGAVSRGNDILDVSVPLRGWVFVTCGFTILVQMKERVSVPLRGWVFVTLSASLIVVGLSGCFSPLAGMGLCNFKVFFIPFAALVIVSVPLRGWVFVTNHRFSNSKCNKTAFQSPCGDGSL